MQFRVFVIEFFTLPLKLKNQKELCKKQLIFLLQLKPDLILTHIRQRRFGLPSWRKKIHWYLQGRKLVACTFQRNRNRLFRCIVTVIFDDKRHFLDHLAWLKLFMQIAIFTKHKKNIHHQCLHMQKQKLIHQSVILPKRKQHENKVFILTQQSEILNYKNMSLNSCSKYRQKEK